ncbi:MAG: translation elongation factor 4 [bacterium]|nr:translation elongation factor 4 [bacterium]
MDQQYIRNFSIIAHIDHGKSTLADRLLELTGTVSKDKLRAQHLDRMDLERERGVTIKLKPVRMQYTLDGSKYMLNLIDTPGHVDFSYEVSRSLAACEGALLIVDATQGIQAQTLAHAMKALEENLDIIPIVNKIDHTNADIPGTMQQLHDVFGFKEEEILQVSAKEGTNVEAVLRAIIERMRAPTGNPHDPLRALIFDSSYDAHKGVIADVRVVDGSIRKGEGIHFAASGVDAPSVGVGVRTPDLQPADLLSAGMVGIIETGFKDIHHVHVGDTVISHMDTSPLPGYKPAKSMVFASLFPMSADSYLTVRDALDKLRLTDAALVVRLTSSKALGNGFRCGFLGLFHAEIVQERLTREFGLDTLLTTPNVVYRIDGVEVENPIETDFSHQSIEEPWATLSIFSPNRCIGPLMQVCQERRGTYQTTEHIGEQAKLVYVMPLSEIMTGLFASLKTASSGYASMDYEVFEYRPVDAVRLDILLNHEPVEPLSRIVVADQAERIGRSLVEKLKEILPRQQFAVPVQAVIGGNIIARETLPAFRKDVTEKLYGGDRTRKDKLLEKQRKGKKRLSTFGRVNIPQDAFFTLFANS